MTKQMPLKYACLKTPVGNMLAIADQQFLYSLQFCKIANLSKTINVLNKKYNQTISLGSNKILQQISTEISQYFTGKLQNFKTPITFAACTKFQQLVLQTLTTVAYGQTKSYLELATLISKPTAYRAVAQANSKNPLCIIVPCHRIINHNGKLGGYSAGITIKKSLLEYEKNLVSTLYTKSKC